MEVSICGIMQICKKFQTLKYFGFQVLGLRMFDFQVLKFDEHLFFYDCEHTKPAFRGFP